jgi:hypothetical protein
MDRHLAQDAHKSLLSATGKPRPRTAGAVDPRSHMVRRVGVETLLHGPRRNRKHAAADARLDRLEVHPIDRARSDQGFDLPLDLRLERRFEAPFLAASSEAASGEAISWSASTSQAFQYASTCSRKRWPASICRFTIAA